MNSSSKHTLVCLHGWGASKDSYTELREALQNEDITLLTPDFPGCGEEPEPAAPMTVDDYADWVENYISEHVSSPYSLICHSHGGRVAIKLLSRLCEDNVQRSTFNVESSTLKVAKPDHLYLCASAGIRHPRHFKRIVGLTLAKTGKFFLSIPGFKLLQPVAKKLLYKLVRVHDYEKASPIMQQTMILVCKPDLRSLLSSITIPTDIFWGEQDGMTPISDAHVMHKEIADSKLHTFPDVRHRVHRDKAAEIAALISSNLQTK